MTLPLRRLDAAVLQSVEQRLRSLPPTQQFEQMLPRSLQPDPKAYALRARRSAAVTVPLVTVDGRASCLFTVRSHKVNTHAGQVSFPGGHVDEGETVAAAAARELREETGVGELRILGQWHRCRAVTGTIVTPVVGYISRELTHAEVEAMAGAAESSHEVDACFAISLTELTSPGVRRMETLKGRWPMPRFNVQPEPVWGLTAFILDGVLRDAFGWRPDVDIRLQAEDS